MRSTNLVPRRVAEFITRALKADQLLLSADHAGRAAYEQRLAASAAASASTEAPPAPAVAMAGEAEAVELEEQPA